MATQISVIDTAALVICALHEAFPNIDFAVKCTTYCDGASIRVVWTNGPNLAQVEAVASRFEGSYFNWRTGHTKRLTHLMGSELVNFGVDDVFCERKHSKAAIERAIRYVYARYAADFNAAGLDKPTVDDYLSGKLYAVRLDRLHWYGNRNLEDEIAGALQKHSDRLRVRPSHTAASIIVVTDEHRLAELEAQQAIARAQATTN
jgi:hypothetical protein